MNFRSLFFKDENKKNDVHDHDQMNPPDKFSLNKGMKRSEIYQELHNRVSGETTHEIQEFFTYNTSWQAQKQIDEIKKYYPKFERPDLEVVDNDSEFALIRKSTITTMWPDHEKLETVNEYYLSGINDEGFYFLHPLHNVPRTFKLEEIKDWTNRKDQGFEERLQGDILLRFIKYRDANIDGSTYDYLYDIHLNISNKDLDDPKIINLGRHKLVIDKGVIITVNKLPDQYNIVESNKIVIVHPEHKVTERDVPKDSFAVLANQRGRKVVNEGRNNTGLYD